MKENYRAWEINVDDFYRITDEQEKLKFLLRFAVLAPSSHNSQPWKFKIENNKIEVFLDEKRKLIYGDKNDRQAYISIGCAIENIATAANYFGWETQIFLAENETSNHAATISLMPKNIKTVAQPSYLIFSVINRITNRNKHNKNPLPADFVSKVEAYSNEKFKVFVVSDKNKINQLADAAMNATLFSWKIKNFRKELSGYVKNNLTNSETGIPVFGMGMPTLISFLVPKMIKYFNISNLSKKDDEKLLKEYTTAIIIIATKEDNKISWIKTGQIYEKIALEADKKKLSASPWAAAIQMGDFYKELQAILSTDFRPQMFFRMGYATGKIPHKSPRIPLNKVLNN